MIPLAAIAELGLAQQGSLLTWEYRLRLPPGVHGRRGDRQHQGRSSRTPAGGCRGLADAGGGLQFWLNRLTQFLSLVGLSALLVGGVGVGNAISSFLTGRLRTIATLKCLGAPERLVFLTYFLQLAGAGPARRRCRRGDRRGAALRGAVG